VANDGRLRRLQDVQQLKLLLAAVHQLKRVVFAVLIEPPLAIAAKKVLFVLVLGWALTFDRDYQRQRIAGATTASIDATWKQVALAKPASVLTQLTNPVDYSTLGQRYFCSPYWTSFNWPGLLVKSRRLSSVSRHHGSRRGDTTQLSR